MSILKSINQKTAVNWPFLHTTYVDSLLEAHYKLSPPPQHGQSDIVGGGHNYADSLNQNLQ